MKDYMHTCLHLEGSSVNTHRNRERFEQNLYRKNVKKHDMPNIFLLEVTWF